MKKISLSLIVIILIFTPPPAGAMFRPGERKEIKIGREDHEAEQRLRSASNERSADRGTSLRVKEELSQHPTDQSLYGAEEKKEDSFLKPKSLTLDDCRRALEEHSEGVRFVVERGEDGNMILSPQELSQLANNGAEADKRSLRGILLQGLRTVQTRLTNAQTVLVLQSLFARECPDIYVEDLFRYNYPQEGMTSRRLHLLFEIIKDPRRDFHEDVSSEEYTENDESSLVEVSSVFSNKDKSAFTDVQEVSNPLQRDSSQQERALFMNEARNVFEELEARDERNKQTAIDLSTKTLDYLNAIKEEPLQEESHFSNIQGCITNFWKKKKRVFNILLSTFHLEEQRNLRSTNFSDLFQETADTLCHNIAMNQYDLVLQSAEERLNALYAKSDDGPVFFTDADLDQMEEAVKRRRQKTSGPSVPSIETFFHEPRVIDSFENEDEEKKRIIKTTLFKTGFKYPHLQMKETLEGNHILTRAITVADHLLVTLKEGNKPAAFVEELQKSFPAMKWLIKEVSLVDPLRFVIECQPSEERQLLEEEQAPEINRGRLVKILSEMLPRLIGEIKTEYEHCVALAEPLALAYKESLNVNHADASYQWGLETIQAPDAWEIRSRADGVIVALLDTGISTDHPQLRANMWCNPLPNNLQDYEHLHGFKIPRLAAGDTDGHGSAGAGIIGGIGDNVIGVTQKVELMDCKITENHPDDERLPPPSGRAITSTQKLADGIRYAISKGAKILNCSFGMSSHSEAVYNLLEEARRHNIIVVCSAGNEGVNIDATPKYPASYAVTHTIQHNGRDRVFDALDNIIVVAATRRNGSRAPFSNYGVQTVHLAAPGEDIYSTLPANQNFYGSQSGTSMAVSYVAGGLALLSAELPQVRPSLLIRHLCDRTIRDGSLNRSGGVLNIAEALLPGDYQIEEPLRTNLNNRFRDVQKEWSIFSNAADLFMRPKDISASWRMYSVNNKLPWVSYNWNSWLPTNFTVAPDKYKSYKSALKKLICVDSFQELDGSHLPEAIRWNYRALYSAHQACLDHLHQSQRVLATKKATAAAAMAYNAVHCIPYNQFISRKKVMNIAKAAWKAAEFAEDIDHWQNPVAWIKRVQEETTQFCDGTNGANGIDNLPTGHNVIRGYESAVRSAKIACNFFIKAVKQLEGDNRNISKLRLAHMAMARVIDLLNLDVAPFLPESNFGDSRTEVRNTTEYARLNRHFWNDDDDFVNEMRARTRSLRDILEAWYREEFGRVDFLGKLWNWLPREH
ncbi:MAG: S8 family serine peptidase [Chthoniobacterales bacterium]|nr:S8 family serine peptidase [Chthoniobacterales bacterium]